MAHHDWHSTSRSGVSVGWLRTRRCVARSSNAAGRAERGQIQTQCRSMQCTSAAIRNGKAAAATHSSTKARKVARAMRKRRNRLAGANACAGTARRRGTRRQSAGGCRLISRQVDATRVASQQVSTRSRRQAARSPPRKRAMHNQSSHRLWAQRPPHLRDCWKTHPGVLQRQQVLELAWLGPRWLYNRQSALFTQERKERAGHRQAYHSLEEFLLSSESSSSVGHVRTGRFVDEFGSLISNVRENPCRDSENEQIRISGTTKRADSRRFKNTSSRPIMTEEVSRNWRELSSLKEEKFIVLIKETNNTDEIKNFFMNNFWNKIGIFVKLMRKVSMRCKNWSDFKDLHSMNFREEDWSKIEILSLNSQARSRNFRMKLILWMTQEISKMLNQYAVDSPTLPVNKCFSHLIQFLKEC